MIPRTRPRTTPDDQTPAPETESVEVVDYDFMFRGTPPLCVSLFDGDTIVDDPAEDFLLILWKNGTITTIYRSHLAYTERRNRTVTRPKKTK